MKVLALVGSPRRGGNTDILVDEILKGANAKGHETQKLRLYDYEILPCIDCRNCKKSELNYNCTQPDDMKDIYPEIESADVVIFGTPLYWYGPTAKMKLLIDRLRPFISSKNLIDKKGIVVIPSEEGPCCCGPLLNMFQMSFDYLGMKMIGNIMVKSYERGEVRNNQENLSKAYDLGVSLITI